MHRTSNGALPRFRTNATPRVADPILPDDRFIAANIPYRILCATGRVLGEAATLHDALDHYNSWAQATAVVLGNYVVLQRKGGAR
jgi:hypothetical protein